MAQPKTEDFNKWESGKKGAAAKKKKGPAMRAHLERGGKKGWISTIHHKNMDEGSQFGPEPTTMMEHPDLQSAMQHIGKQFGEPMAASAQQEPAPAPQPAAQA